MGGESASSSMQAPPLASEKQMHVAAELAAAITGLHLKTAQLKAMHKQDEAVLTEARQLRSASLNARSMEQVAQGRTVNMKSLVQGLGHHIERSEEDMQLTQTLFAREEDTSRDLGESSDVATKTSCHLCRLSSIMSKMPWRRQKLLFVTSLRSGPNSRKSKWPQTKHSLPRPSRPKMQSWTRCTNISCRQLLIFLRILSRNRHSMMLCARNRTAMISMCVI